MVKKKKKKLHKAKHKLKAKKLFKKQSPHKDSAEISKTLVVSGEVLKDTSTTFSKKLEEVISENENRKGFFGRRIILLNAPLGYSKEEWKKFLKSFWKSVYKFLLIILALAVFVGIVVGIEYFANQKVLPKINIVGQSYQYLTPDQTRENLKQQLAGYSNSEFTFTYQGKSARIPLSELGIQYDLNKTLAGVPFFNFQKNSLFDLIWSEFNARNLPLVYNYDEKKVYSLVEKKFGLTAARAQNAQFYIDDKKKLQIRQEKDGLMIDPADFHNKLTSSLSQYVPFVDLYTIQEKAGVKSSDLEKYKDDLQLKLESPVALKYGEKNWKLIPKNHLEDLSFDKVNDQVLIKFSPALISDFLQKEVFDNFEIPVSDLKINYDTATQKVSFDGQAKNGLLVDKAKFLDDLNLAVNSLDPDIDIPVQEVKANLEIAQPLQDMGIKELISTGHTSFSGSPVNRRFNIGVGMSKFNGLIIKPGETFSFDDNLGAVDGSTGYKLELVIKAEGTIPEFGGGVCQVSSTMFKAALLAGFPIVERAPHSYAVGYYAQVDGYGLDSTIYPGVRDLKFTNDSGNNVLIQTFVDGDNAYINFFGTNDGRDVKLENYWRGNFRSAGGTELIPTSTLPTGTKKQIESAHGGFDASWDRVVYRDGKEERRDKISSSYRATSNRILVGQ